MLRRPTRNITRVRRAPRSTLARAIPSRTSSTTMMLFIGMPNRLFLAVVTSGGGSPLRDLLIHDKPVHHVDDAVGEGGYPRIVSDQDECLLIALVQLHHELHDLVGVGGVQVCGGLI